VSDWAIERVALPTGVELDVAVAGDRSAPPVILLHGFPESHRAWRYQIPALAERRFVLAPDQRGFARSSKPDGVAAYATGEIVADMLALADHFGIGGFTLIGHDWGGAVAWMAALNHPDRVERLVILNAPHPFLFQQRLFDDAEQRAASQYISALRSPGFEARVAAIGLDAFFDRMMAGHGNPDELAAERPHYLAQWAEPGALTAMVNWYRASPIIVPAPDDVPERPAFLDRPFPPVTQPTLVVWGTADPALRPSLLDGLAPLVADLTLVKVEGGHFIPWDAPAAVNAALLDWL